MLSEFSRSAEDCRARIKRLKTQYFQIKRQSKKPGGKRKTFTYFERLDEMLGSRPSVNPLCNVHLFVSNVYFPLDIQNDDSDRPQTDEKKRWSSLYFWKAVIRATTFKDSTIFREVRPGKVWWEAVLVG